MGRVTRDVATDRAVAARPRTDGGPRRGAGAATGVRAVAFDLGGVLIDWNPRYLYRPLFAGDEAGMERFLAEVCTPAWNAKLDAGASWDEAVAALSAEHPDLRELIAAYRDRWDEMLGGAFDGTVDIVRELRTTGVPLYVLSNWALRTFPVTHDRYDFLDWFDGTVISGEVGVGKPDPRIFRHLLDRFELEPAATVFIDDLERNVDAARSLGMIGIRFVDAAHLRRDLAALGLPVAVTAA